MPTANISYNINHDETNENKRENRLLKYLQLIIALALVIFNIGYTVARLDDKPSRTEMQDEINKTLSGYDKSLKNNYIEIKKVPGLTERLNSIDQNLQDLKSRFENLENKILIIKK
ncbi:MAG: hypothetical protein P4L45_06715 [Ignavibacteriaceae bacterium]|nr:hypothetical protein [Ignavibacteriaceae bacterium]